MEAGEPTAVAPTCPIRTTVLYLLGSSIILVTHPLLLSVFYVTFNFFSSPVFPIFPFQLSILLPLVSSFPSLPSHFTPLPLLSLLFFFSSLSSTAHSPLPPPPPPLLLFSPPPPPLLHPLHSPRTLAHLHSVAG